jgi:hypothetical protein
MVTRQNYISIGWDYDYLSSFKSRFIPERIGFVLYVIRSNIDDKIIYDDSYQLHMFLKKTVKTENDLYCIKNRDFLFTLTDFLKTVPRDWIEYVDYYDNENVYCGEDIEFMLLDLLFQEIDEIIQFLENIISSFEYNYQLMKKKGENFYMELSKYVHNPKRIERISKKYNMEWYEYLDVIDF